MESVNTTAGLEGAPECYVWHPAGSPLKVIVTRQAAERMRQEAVRRGSGEEPGLGGGLLLGPAEPAGPAVVTVDDVEPLDWSYALTHRRALVDALARHAPGNGGKHVVGFFRTDSHEDLFLNASDLALIRTYFPNPSNVFLLLKAGPGEELITRFFFRHENQWKSADAGFAFGEPPSGARDESHAPAPHAPKPAARAPRTALPRSLPPPMHAPRATRVKEPAAAPPTKRALVWALSAVALATGLVVYLGGARWRAPAPAASQGASASDLALQVERSQADLILRWNRQAPVVANAQRAVLHIQDGPYQVPYELDSDQLRTGSVYYTPLSNDVRLRLEVVDGAGRQVVESVRVLAAVAPVPNPLGLKFGEPAAVPAAQPALDPADLSVRAARRPAREAERIGIASRTAPPAPALRFAPRATAAEPLALEAPPDVAQGRSNPVGSVIIPGAQAGVRFAAPSRPPAAPPIEPAPASPGPPAQPLSAAAVPPAQPAPVRTSSYTEARAVRKVQPLLPASLRKTLGDGTAEISVRVQVDEQGKVTRADLAGQKGAAGTMAVAATLDAARAWRFQPATSGDKPVPGTVLIVFRFGR